MKAFTLKKKSFLSPPFPRLTHLHTNGKFWAKLYIPSTVNTQINIALFLSLGRLERQGSTENFCNLSVFSYIHEQNKY